MQRQVTLLKNEKIDISGTVCLGPGHQLAPVRVETPSQANNYNNSATTAQMPKQATIIETTAGYTIIEFTCSCGQKSRVQCNYASITE